MSTHIGAALALLQNLGLTREARRERNKMIVSTIMAQQGGQAEGLVWIKMYTPANVCNLILDDYKHTNSIIEKTVDMMSDLVEAATIHVGQIRAKVVSSIKRCMPNCLKSTSEGKIKWMFLFKLLVQIIIHHLDLIKEVGVKTFVCSDSHKNIKGHMSFIPV